MKEKLRILIQNENLTASKLAEILEIKPAGVSHILSGRNNPSFELVCKLINRFPKINPYWLLGDAENMYNNTAADSTSTTDAPMEGQELFSNPSTEEASPKTAFDASNRNATNRTSAPAVPSSISTQIAGVANGSEIERVIVIYRDNSFESFTPKR